MLIEMLDFGGIIMFSLLNSKSFGDEDFNRQTVTWLDLLLIVNTELLVAFALSMKNSKCSGGMREIFGELKLIRLIYPSLLLKLLNLVRLQKRQLLYQFVLHFFLQPKLLRKLQHFD